MPTNAEPTWTTDRQNHDLSLQLLRLYASQEEVTAATLQVLIRRSLPTLQDFASALVRLRN